MHLIFDYETYSELNIRSVGTQVYARNCEVMLCAYRIGFDGETQMWDRTVDPDMPADLEAALLDEDVRLLAHNVTFERAVTLQFFGIDLPWHRWDDTMVLALTAGLPGRMELLCEALGWGEEKGKLADGKRLINLFCSPAPKNHKARRYTRENKPEEWERFKEYCVRDVDVTCDLWRELPHWTYESERACWMLDATINERGVPFDVELAEAAIVAVDEALQECNAEMAELTDGAVPKVTNTQALAEWLGVESVAKAALEKLLTTLAEDSPEYKAAALRLRAGKSSVAKYKAGLRQQWAGRIYNSLQFYGAGRTGRWAGRGIQPQNMLRPSKALADHLDQVVAALKKGVADLLFDDVLDCAASATRCMFGMPASSPKKFTVSDLSNIEGRMGAALAGEEWKLQAFRNQDAGGDDVYRLSYAKSFGVDVDLVTGQQRQIGKVQELALEYQGGPGAYVSMAANYNINPQDVVAPVRDVVTDAVWQNERELYRKKKARGLTRDQWTALSLVVNGWREAHPNIRAMWRNLEAAAIAAVRSFNEREPGKLHGKVMRVRSVSFMCTTYHDRVYLLCRLPSGRKLVYFAPEIVETPFSYVDRKTGEDVNTVKESLRFYGVHNNRWVRISTYGGKWMENITQACSRDVLAPGMQRAEDAGYPIVLTVHDELLSETPDTDEYTERELSSLLAQAPLWVQELGMPLGAAGYEGKFYRKD